LILSQKCRPSGEKLGEFFKRRRMKHGLLEFMGILYKKNLFALLQAENEGITWKSYMCDLPHGVLKLAVNSSI
jgi:hypothetical protein